MADVQEALARALHDAYVRQRLAEGESLGATPSLTEWDKLPEEFKQSSRRNARDISLAVETLGYELKPMSGSATLRVLGRDEIELVAERLHERWVEERETTGWRVGTHRDEDRRIHPDLVPWDNLPDERREIDRHLVRELPGLLHGVGLVLERTH